MNLIDKNKAIVLLEKLRLVESEMFRLASRYGVKTVDELDNMVVKGKLSEAAVGEDVFRFDALMVERDELRKELNRLSIKLELAWENLQNLLALPKLNLAT